jgi:Raf kinase inhibitor-like YbhB/YbcL family protein
MRSALLPTAVLGLSIALGACSSGSGPSANPGGGSPAAAAASASSSAPGASTTEVSPMTVMPSTTSPSASTAGTFSLTSSAFADGDAIPRELTCDGTNVSPPLAWSGAPGGTVALALVVDDPDANDFVHWIVLDLTGADGSLAQGVDPGAATPQQGTNDFGKIGWGGPCPPSGTHHYRFTLTALGTKLALDGHPSADAVRSALAKAGAAAIGTATLTGTYTRG